jgi:hypothetical protein
MHAVLRLRPQRSAVRDKETAQIRILAFWKIFASLVAARLP